MQDDDVDLTGVDPVRRDEIRRRVRVVKAYLALDRPRKEDAERCAAEIGIGLNQFHTLVRAWLLHGKASALPGAVKRTDVLRGRGPRYLDERAESAISAVLEAADPDAPDAELLRRVRTLCAAEDLAPPSATAVRSRAAARRAARVDVRVPGREIVAGRSATDLPVVRSDGTLAPVVLAVALNAGSKEIIAWETGDGFDPPSLVGLIRAVIGAGSSDAAAGRMFVDLGAGPERIALEGALRSAGLDGAIRIGARDGVDPRIPRALGGRLGTVRLTQYARREGWTMGTTLPGLRSRPMSPADAAAFVGESVESHNASILARVERHPGYRLGDGVAALVLERAFENLSG